MSQRLSLITCITNSGGRGPGHTAILIGETVYSFENIGDWFSVRQENSGWVVIELDRYLENNRRRPVVFQDLNELVDRARVQRWIDRSIGSDMDYLSSGVCSSVVCSAIEAGFSGSFNPSGIDTPYKTFHLARNKGIVRSTTMVWADRSALPADERRRIEDKIEAEYPMLVPQLWGNDLYV